MKQRVIGKRSGVVLLGLVAVLAAVFVVGLSAMNVLIQPRNFHGGRVAFRPAATEMKDVQSFVISSGEVTADGTPSQRSDDRTQATRVSPTPQPTPEPVPTPVPIVVDPPAISPGGCSPCGGSKKFSTGMMCPQAVDRYQSAQAVVCTL